MTPTSDLSVGDFFTYPKKHSSENETYKVTRIDADGKLYVSKLGPEQPFDASVTEVDKV